MTTSTATKPAVRTPRPAPRPSSRPRLAVLTRPEPRRSAVPFVIMCTAIIVATLATVLYLNIQMSSTSYEITRLQGQSQSLTEKQQGLEQQNDELGTPQKLEKKAQDLGMVPAGTPAYIDLGTGKVTGDSTPVTGDTTKDDAPTSDESAVPPATIYQEEQSYHGMGNEGN
jgi:cell division protein FtsL